MLSDTANLSPAPCPSCGGSGWEPVGDQGVRPCSCKKLDRPDLLLARSRVPARFSACTLDNFEPYCHSLQRAQMYTRRFVDQYPLVDTGLLYLGACGVGKTHLAAAALKALIGKGIHGLFYDFRDLLKEIQESYNPNTHTSELAILAPIFEAEMLVLDELGASKPTAWVQETITHIINKRYNDRKVTIFTSNYLDTVPRDSRAETLTERVGIRLRSRLFEMCRLVPMEGDDYRTLIRNRRDSPFISR